MIFLKKIGIENEEDMENYLHFLSMIKNDNKFYGIFKKSIFNIDYIVSLLFDINLEALISPEVVILLLEELKTILPYSIF